MSELISILEDARRMIKSSKRKMLRSFSTILALIGLKSFSNKNAKRVLEISSKDKKPSMSEISKPNSPNLCS